MFNERDIANHGGRRPEGGDNRIGWLIKELFCVVTFSYQFYRKCRRAKKVFARNSGEVFVTDLVLMVCCRALGIRKNRVRQNSVVHEGTKSRRNSWHLLAFWMTFRNSWTAASTGLYVLYGHRRWLTVVVNAARARSCCW